MKVIPIFLLCAAAAFAGDFTTGQAARLMIGQQTFTAQDSNSSDTILGGASGLENNYVVDGVVFLVVAILVGIRLAPTIIGWIGRMKARGSRR